MSELRLRHPPDPWGRIFRKHISKGEDHGYAAYMADKAQERWAKKYLPECPHCGKPVDPSSIGRRRNA